MFYILTAFRKAVIHMYYYEHVEWIIDLHLVYKQCVPAAQNQSLSNTGIFVAVTNNTLYGSKLYIFISCQKSLGY